ncbi:H2.0-like homeobox protein-like protein [Perkinsela sp. CCAP 1560/4]|nr:H2.0-like homeobox protein-like protein [Perkinsela sp. CCAP 1560/4]|eukprot:KNH05936.1 H2.0-like homeobox protein-like protein [Perkinsela sp. CCAP 1560/4]
MSIFNFQRRRLRFGLARQPPPVENRPRNLPGRPTEAPQLPKCSYPDVNSTVLGSVVPSFRNFTSFSSQVLQLYRDFWRLVYRLPVEDQEAAKIKLRTRFRRASHVKGQKHILQILKNARSEREHWRGLVESMEISRSRPIERSLRPERPPPQRVQFQDLVKLRYDSKSRTFAVDPGTLGEGRADSPSETLIVETARDSLRFSSKVRDFYLQRASQHGANAVQLSDDGLLPAPSGPRPVPLFADNPSEFAWEDVRRAMNNTIPFVRAVGSIGYLQNSSLLKPRREALRRRRTYGWNLINQRTAKGLRGFEP